MTVVEQLGILDTAGDDGVHQGEVVRLEPGEALRLLFVADLGVKHGLDVVDVEHDRWPARLGQDRVQQRHHVGAKYHDEIRALNR